MLNIAPMRTAIKTRGRRKLRTIICSIDVNGIVVEIPRASNRIPTECEKGIETLPIVREKKILSTSRMVRKKVKKS
jgi:hypothetical protein